METNKKSRNRYYFSHSHEKCVVHKTFIRNKNFSQQTARKDFFSIILDICIIVYTTCIIYIDNVCKILQDLLTLSVLYCVYTELCHKVL